MGIEVNFYSNTVLKQEAELLSGHIIEAMPMSPVTRIRWGGEERFSDRSPSDTFGYVIGRFVNPGRRFKCDKGYPPLNTMFVGSIINPNGYHSMYLELQDYKTPEVKDAYLVVGALSGFSKQYSKADRERLASLSEGAVFLTRKGENLSV